MPLAAGDLNTRWAGTAYGVTRPFPPSIAKAERFDIDVRRLKGSIIEATERAGWTFRFVFLPFQATRSGLSISRAFVPPAFRTWPSRRFWGVVYPFSFFGLVLAIFAAVGGVATDPESLLAVTLVVGGWWAVWGLLAWAYLKLGGHRATRPARPRSPRRKRT